MAPFFAPSRALLRLPFGVLRQSQAIFPGQFYRPICPGIFNFNFAPGFTRRFSNPFYPSICQPISKTNLPLPFTHEIRKRIRKPKGPAMSNGKGSRARNNHSQAFRANYDDIDWKPLDKNRKREELTDFFVIMPDTPDYGWYVKNPSKRPNGLSSTSEASKPLKTQGNGLETHPGRRAKEAK